MQQRASFVLLLIAVAATATCVLAADAPPPAFNFHDYLIGEWEVVRGSGDVAAGEQQFDAVIRGHYFIERENGTANLVGRYYDNDTATGEITNEQSVSIEFTTSNSGIWRVSGVDAAFDADSEDSKPSTASDVFTFAFEQHHPHGVALSFGEYTVPTTEKNAKPALYQFAVTAWDRFVISLFPNPAAGAAPAAAGAGVSVFLGRKIVVNTTKTFWQQYSTIIMMGGFFLLNMFIKQKTAGYQAKQVAGARRATRDKQTADEIAALAGGAPRKSKATVEVEDEPAETNSSRKKA